MPEEGITFGAPILETLTTGMYREPLTVFREYVQNSCDSIDVAINAGIIQDGEGKIDIAIDFEARRITITDNGTGIKASDFRRVMGNIADSDKRQAESRGFRGIGRLCGMAYCRTLTFTAKFKGEGVISRLVCDGGVLRELLHESDSGINRYTASEVLGMINEFNAENVDDIDGHYFRVELDGINDENTSLLDFDGVRDYLSFVAPLPYSNNFIVFRSEIHRHAEGLGFKIDEYDIFLNGEQLFKPYTLKYHTSLGGDEIFDVAFRDFIDDDGNIIAWMWFGLSCFRGAIKKGTLMQCIRLRKRNIQIGNEYALQKLFEEDRGITYFIGELFCVSDGLMLNTERNCFINNSSWAELESQIKQYFTELKRIYYDSSRAYNLFKKYDDPRKGMKAEEDIQKLRAKGGLIRKIVDCIEGRYAHDSEKQHEAPQRYTPREREIMSKIFDIIRSELDTITAEKLITHIQNSLQ